MIRYVFLSVLVLLTCSVTTEAADLPRYTPRVKQLTTNPIPKIKAIQPKKATKARAPSKSVAPQKKPTVAENQAAVQGTEIDLTWSFAPVTANADGRKNEGSDSIEGNLVVGEPGVITNPDMQIELNGFIVKTVDTTVRIDVKIAGAQYSANWASEDVASGQFKVTLNGKLPVGTLPEYLPVTAIAWVTKSSKQGAALVSLERINFRVNKIRIAENQ